MPQLECLECVVMGTPVLVPTRDLDRVTEYRLTPPPPLSEPWIGGLGLVDGSLWVSIALAGEPRGPLAECKGLLLVAPDRQSRYALQVESVGAIARVEPGVAIPGPIPWPCPAWWLAATAVDGEDVLRLDTDALAAALYPARVAARSDA